MTARRCSSHSFADSSGPTFRADRNTRLARWRQMAPILTAEHLVSCIAAHRAHVAEPGAPGIRPEPAAAIGWDGPLALRS
jgi:hypothetical protein